MKSYRLAFSLMLGLILLPLASVSADPRLAPADEYFGPTKMSPLEITNRISEAERTGPRLSLLLLTQAAIEDWTRQYPEDTWIPEREYRIARLFAQIGTDQAQAMATWCHSFLQQHFPGDHYTLQADQDLGPVDNSQ
ncbi:MAG TPA: hypothetical protein VME66_06620 [Candidatus Acidoferrales bacterium]|nr:hypothetical protein [Candidatus Acidoferrales bacterium]